MSRLNYEAIYKVRQSGVDTSSLSNLLVRARNKAEADAKKEHDRYRAVLSKILGHQRFEVTDIGCMADGIIGHVYTWEEPEPRKGLGERTCLFCGCDDFDD